MDAGKTTGGLPPSGSMKDVFCIPLIQDAMLNLYREHQLIMRLRDSLRDSPRESSAGPRKPTMPTSGST